MHGLLSTKAPSGCQWAGMSMLATKGAALITTENVNDTGSTAEFESPTVAAFGRSKEHPEKGVLTKQG
ncbi:hypothetical protein [Rhodopila sp.]|uniref:hypothetical protein n=1 Tax=Rhodopila sp. TaxID=2480087 RepID=UPI003D09DC1E